MDLISGALKSTRLLWHHFAKMVHLASLTDLAEPLRGVSNHAVTTSEKPCSLICGTLGAWH